MKHSFSCLIYYIKTKRCLMPWVKVFLRTDDPCSSEPNTSDGTELLAWNRLQSFSKQKFYHRPENKNTLLSLLTGSSVLL